MTDWLPYESSEDLKYLHNRLREGEHTYQDFKHTINDYHKIARSVVAFANQKGGSLFIGVDDKGGILGTVGQSEYYRLADILEHYCHPVPEAECVVYHDEEGDVLEVVVHEGHEKPYTARDKSDNWIIYLRVNDTCKKIGKVG
jgi:predicted HTH transcriptional regulator